MTSLDVYKLEKSRKPMIYALYFILFMVPQSNFDGTPATSKERHEM